MWKIPVRFERVAAVFEYGGRVSLCESSGSENSPPGTLDLSDLVKSFIERDDRVQTERESEGNDGAETDGDCSYSEIRESLRSLFGSQDNRDDYCVRRKIKAGAEYASRLVEEKPSSPGFKRKLMACLRGRGLDAGLCKTQREKFGRYPAGNYEYIDINAGGERYVIEFCLSREFEIARPTRQFTSLLELLPQVFVGKVEEMKQVGRLMCAAIKESMKSEGMHVPPWRRNGYVQAKWSASYKRTTNLIQAKKFSEESAEVSEGKRSVAFELEAFPAISFYCAGDVARNCTHKVGYLTAAFNGDGIGLH